MMERRPESIPCIPFLSHSSSLFAALMLLFFLFSVTILFFYSLLTVCHLKFYCYDITLLFLLLPLYLPLLLNLPLPLPLLLPLFLHLHLPLLLPLPLLLCVLLVAVTAQESQELLMPYMLSVVKKVNTILSSTSLLFFLLVPLSIYASINVSIYLSTYLLTFLCICLPV